MSSLRTSARTSGSVDRENPSPPPPLVLAETYALVDAYLFGLCMWRVRRRGAAPPPAPDATVDIFVTTYNEPVEMVMATATAARDARFPHETWILDDGSRPELAAAAAAAGVGYLTRSDDWVDRPRHAKAGNLNNALFRTTGEFLLVLDADQVPDPAIIEHTLGWFTDPAVALVQSPQWFTNVTGSDPLGSQAPLFYGPIQQGKDGWESAFFCGSNALLRREALMQLGIVGYVRAVEAAVDDTLRAASRLLRRAARGRGPDAAVAAGVAGAVTRRRWTRSWPSGVGWWRCGCPKSSTSRGGEKQPRTNGVSWGRGPGRWWPRRSRGAIRPTGSFQRKSNDSLRSCRS